MPPRCLDRRATTIPESRGFSRDDEGAILADMALADAVAERVDAACRGASGAVSVERAVTAVIGEVVPFDMWCVLTVDPATILSTGGFHEKGLPPPYLPRLVEIEAANEDALALPSLARSDTGVDTLSAATQGDLMRSARYRDIFAPVGVAHELRALFKSKGDAWGAMILLRGEGEPDFDADEVGLVKAATAHVADSIRREMLLTEIAISSEAGGPGLLILDPDLQPISSTARAQELLAEFDDGVMHGTDLPLSLLSVAARSRAIEPSRTVRTRMRGRSGRWLTLHADRQPDNGVSVIIEATRPTEIAELIADAYDLTARERTVVRLLATGSSRAEIARQLAISHHTVDDHIKRTFAKVGVQSRAELTARLFFDQHLPRIKDEVPIGGTGWYLH